jgi:hypothetical protein
MRAPPVVPPIGLRLNGHLAAKVAVTLVNAHRLERLQQQQQQHWRSTHHNGVHYFSKSAAVNTP